MPKTRAAEGRPSRLLNVRSRPVTVRKITTANSVDSPFLRLPPEIRDRIYRYALGGQHIHIPSFPTDRLSLCINPLDTAEEIENYQSAGPRPVIPDYIAAHRACQIRREPTGYIINLALLQTCRQIYQEAVLIPFSANTFNGSMWAFRDFLPTLVPAQIRAIGAVDLVRNIYVPTTSGFITPIKAKQLIGMRKLVVRLQLYPNHGDDSQLKAHFDSCCVEIVNEMGHGQLKEVEVMVYWLNQPRQTS